MDPSAVKITTNREGKKVVKVTQAEPGRVDVLDDPSQYDLFRTRGFLLLHSVSGIVQFSLLMITILLSKWDLFAPIFTTLLLDEPNSQYIRTVWVKTNVYLVPIFVYIHGLSFTFHLGTLFLWRRPYLRWRQDAISPLRWLHTALTSPVRTALVLYSAGIREATGLALIFLIRIMTHVVSLTNEIVSRTVNTMQWSLGPRTRLWLCVIILLTSLVIWMVTVVIIININTVTNAVTSVYGIILFISHSVFVILSYANHGIFLLQSPTRYYRSEYLAIICETCDAILVTSVFLNYVLRNSEYMWNDKVWQH